MQLKKELGQNNSNLKSRMGDIAEDLEGGEEEEEAEQECQEIMKVAKTSGKTNTPKRRRGKRLLIMLSEAPGKRIEFFAE